MSDRMPRHRWLRLLGALALAACGSESTSQPDAMLAVPDARIPVILDAGPDADLRDATPPPRGDGGELLFGPGLILNRVRLSESGHSWAPYAPLANPEYDSAIADGTLIVLLDLRGLDDPSGQVDADGLSVGIYNGIDPDSIPYDNFSGSEEIEVYSGSLDAIGNPRALLPDATLAGGVVSGASDGPLILYLPTVGAIPVYDVAFRGTLVASATGDAVASMEAGSISGTLLARDLAAVPNNIPSTCLGDTLLDIIAIGCLAVDGVQPDVDRDGDGLEAFGETTGRIDWVIDTCIDGNGIAYTSLPGVPCALDPAFADGYTVQIDVKGVRAVLLPPAMI